MKVIVIFCFIGLAVCAPPEVQESEANLPGVYNVPEETTHHSMTTALPDETTHHLTTEIEVGEYFLNKPTEPQIHCIKAKFSAQITLSYPIADGETRNASVSVPTDSETRGECDGFLELAWSISGSSRKRRSGATAENTLRLDVSRDAEKDVYYVSGVSFSLLRDDTIFPGIIAGPPLTDKMSNLREFETSTSNSYSCFENKLSDSQFEVTFSGMQFEAYNEIAGSEFKTAVACRVMVSSRSDPYRTANYVGIAVGVSIGVMLLGAGGAALVSRYRKRRKAAAALIRTDTTYQQFDS